MYKAQLYTPERVGADSDTVAVKTLKGWLHNTGDSEQFRAQLCTCVSAQMYFNAKKNSSESILEHSKNVFVYIIAALQIGIVPTNRNIDNKEVFLFTFIAPKELQHKLGLLDFRCCRIL